MSDSVQPHRWQPTRLRHPWNSPGKNTGVGCHFLLQCMKMKSESEVAQSLSRVQLLVTPWTTAYQAPPSMGFSRQEYWGRVPLLLCWGDARSDQSELFRNFQGPLAVDAARSLLLLDNPPLPKITRFGNYPLCIITSKFLFKNKWEVHFLPCIIKISNCVK